VALDFKPVPEKLAHWAEIGVTETLFGLPDRSESEVAAYVERLAGKLGLSG
jgi:hypothetical protein